MIKEITISNFRGIKHLNLSKLNKINIFVGENASSKSSILDAIFTSINPNNPELYFRTNIFRGIGQAIDIPGSVAVNDSFWKSLFFEYNIKNKISIELLGGKYERSLQIEAQTSTGEDQLVTNEELVSKISQSAEETSAKTISGINVKFKGKDRNKQYKSTMISGDGGMKFIADSRYIEQLNGHYLNNFTFVDNQSIFSRLSEVIQRKKTNEVVKLLQVFEPAIQDISLSNRGIEVDDARYETTESINNYGDGILRALHIVANTVLLGDNNLLLIDEMENGLHWSRQQDIWRMLLNILSTQECQIFITTHSIEFINNLKAVLEDIGDYSDIVSLYRIEKKGKPGILNSVRFNTEDLLTYLDTNLELR